MKLHDDSTTQALTSHAALRYAALGWSIFPCHSINDAGCECGKENCPSPGKHPLTADGFKSATTDQQQIIAWWSAHPTANIGLATGSISGVWCLDVDNKASRGKFGDVTLAELVDKHSEIDERIVQYTPSGGRHIIFKHNGINIHSRSAVIENSIDVRGNGGYFIAAPSVGLNSDGEPQEYYWSSDNDPLVDAPDLVDAPAWLIDLVTKSKTSNTPVNGDLPPMEPRILSDVRAALAYIDPEPYSDWLIIGMALHDSATREAFGAWCEWSSMCQEKYTLGAQHKKWDSFKREDGVTLKTLFSMAMKRGWVNQQNDPLHLQRMGQSALNSALSATEHTTTARLTLSHVSTLLEQPEPLTWRIRDFILPESNNFLIGAPAAGKSLIAIDWAACVATGTVWKGFAVEQGGCVILAGEGHFGIARRLMAWQTANEVELSGAPLSVSNAGACLAESGGLDEVLSALDMFSSEYAKPVLVIIDTLHRNLGAADENSAQDMAVYFNNLDQIRDRYGCALLTVHHSGHMDVSRGRGSSSIRAAVDAEFNVCRSGTDGEVLTLSCQKMKDAPKPAPRNFEITQIQLPWCDTDGVCETSVTIKRTNATATKSLKPMAKNITLAIETLHAVITDRGEINDDRNAVHLETWRSIYYRHHTGDSLDTKLKAFNRTRKELVDEGVATVRDDWYSLNSGAGAKWADAHGFIAALNLTSSRDQNAA